MRNYLLLFASLFLLSCQNASSPLEPEVGKEFNIKYRQQATIQGEDLLIEFREVVEDSRCPKGVQCVWAGNAEITIMVNENPVNLNTYLEPKEAIISGYQIELISVNPYPVYQLPMAKENYSARLLITKINI